MGIIAPFAAYGTGAVLPRILFIRNPIRIGRICRTIRTKCGAEMDYALWTFLMECVVALGSLPFFYLAWASGYVGYMWRAARRNRWGLALLSHEREGAATWEEELSK
jgi:hypothetical protein